MNVCESLGAVLKRFIAGRGGKTKQIWICVEEEEEDDNFAVTYSPGCILGLDLVGKRRRWIPTVFVVSLAASFSCV